MTSPVVSLDPLFVFGDVFGVEELRRRRILPQLMRRHGARVHESLRDDGQTSVQNIRLVDVEDEVGVFDQVDPEAERQRVGFPSVDYFRIRDAVMHGLVIQEVKHVFDRQR